MTERIFHTSAGTLRLQGWHDETMERAAELGTELAREPRTHGELIPFNGSRAYLKASALRGRAGVRHALRRAFLARKVPRIKEYFNLSWLTERHFQTALPLAAGVFLRAGVPRFQYLLTREVPESRTLREELETSRGGDRAALIDELAREVGRMHALGFVHHDLFPRNVLVKAPAFERRVVFLDAWAGGPPTQVRGPVYDLACFFLEGAELLAPHEQDAFLATYFAERAANGRHADEARTMERVARARRALLRRLLREPARLRGRALPPAEWRSMPS